MLNEVKKEVDFMVSNALSKFPETPSSFFPIQRILRGHPNIVNLIDSTWNRLPDGRYEGYILMEYCSGQAILLHHYPESVYGSFMGSSTSHKAIKAAETCISRSFFRPSTRVSGPRLLRRANLSWHCLLCSLSSLPPLSAHPTSALLGSTFDPRGDGLYPDSARSRSCNGIPNISCFFRWWHHRHDEPTPARTSHRS